MLFIKKLAKKVAKSKQFLATLMFLIGVTWTFTFTFIWIKGADISLFVSESVVSFFKPNQIIIENPVHISVAMAENVEPQKEIKSCEDAVEVYGKEYGNSDLIGRIVKAESGVYGYKAASKLSSARGCAQFILSSWEQYGKEHWGSDFYTKSVYSPKDNVELLAWVVSQKGTNDWNASRSVWAK